MSDHRVVGEAVEMHQRPPHRTAYQPRGLWHPAATATLKANSSSRARMMSGYSDNGPWSENSICSSSPISGIWRGAALPAAEAASGVSAAALRWRSPLRGRPATPQSHGFPNDTPISPSQASDTFPADQRADGLRRARSLGAHGARSAWTTPRIFHRSRLQSPTDRERSR